MTTVQSFKDRVLKLSGDLKKLSRDMDTARDDAEREVESSHPDDLDLLDRETAWHDLWDACEYLDSAVQEFENVVTCVEEPER
jgi:hypothetical protein